MMKTGKKLFLTIGILLLISSAIHAQAGESATFKIFYDNLSQFGKWLKDPVHGYVWVPKVEKEFRPYFTNGSWKMTEFGSTWISNYAWGWAPFHYGRWVFDSFYGWVWIPGLEWGPAWVVWRSNGKNYGWTPLIPGFTVSQSLGPDFLVPADRWIFIPSRYLLNPAFQKYAKSNAQYNLTMLKETNVVKNTDGMLSYISGPRPENYARSTGLHITVYTLSSASKPGKAIMKQEEISLYKPGIKKWDSGNEPVPAKFTKAAQPIGKPAALENTIGTSQPKTKAKKSKK